MMYSYCIWDNVGNESVNIICVCVLVHILLMQLHSVSKIAFRHNSLSSLFVVHLKEML